MKFVNTLEYFDFEDYIKTNGTNYARNFDLYTLFTNEGHEFTQNQFAELFFARRNGKTYLACYELFIKMYRELKVPNTKGNSIENTFRDTKRFTFFVRQFRDIFGNGFEGIVSLEYKNPHSIKMIRLENYGKEIYE